MIEDTLWEMIGHTEKEGIEQILLIELEKLDGHIVMNAITLHVHFRRKKIVHTLEYMEMNDQSWKYPKAKRIKNPFTGDEELDFSIHPDLQKASCISEALYEIALKKLTENEEHHLDQMAKTLGLYKPSPDENEGIEFINELSQALIGQSLDELASNRSASEKIDQKKRRLLLLLEEGHLSLPI